MAKRRNVRVLLGRGAGIVARAVSGNGDRRRNIACYQQSLFDYPSADWVFAERIEARVRTKELPSYRTEIGAGRELIDREMEPYLVDTVEHPDCVAADASRRLW